MPQATSEHAFGARWGAGLLSLSVTAWENAFRVHNLEKLSQHYHLT
jgi:hypothetical protein